MAGLAEGNPRSAIAATTLTKIEPAIADRRYRLLPLEVLHSLFVFLRCSFGLECAQIPALPRFRIFLPGIQPILARLKFPDHETSLLRTAPRSIEYS